MKLQEPLMTAILALYPVHRRFFYVNYFENFKLFVSWLTEEEVGTDTILNEHNRDIPWFAGSYELQELAIILKCSQGELYKVLMELENK